MTPQPTNPQKQRKGFARLWYALGYSLSGLRSGWHEPAFRQEAVAFVILLPAALWLGQNWVERAFLIATMVLVMIAELLNTAIESAVDRIGYEWHAESKRAKDTASAAVLLSLLMCAGVWAVAIFQRLTV